MPMVKPSDIQYHDTRRNGACAVQWIIAFQRPGVETRTPAHGSIGTYA